MMNFLSFFIGPLSFYFSSREKEKKKELIGRVLFTKRISVSWLIFFFYFYIYLFFLCVSFRYLVLQKIAHPCYAVTRSMPTSRVY